MSHRNGNPSVRNKPEASGIGLRRDDVALWLAALAPIAFLPGLQDRWGWPKLLVLLMAAAVAAWAVPRGRLPRWALLWGAAFAVVFVAAAVLGQAPIAQLMGRAPRYEGLIGVATYGVAVWVGARLLGPVVEARRLRTWLAATSAAAIALGVIAIAEAAGLRPIESDLVRPGSLAGNATDQGLLAVILFAILSFAVLGTWRRTGVVLRLPLAGMVAAFAAIVTSASRAAVLSFAVVLILIAAIAIARARHRTRAVLVTSGVVVVSVIALLLVPLTRTRLLGLGAFARQTIDDRFAMWQDAAQVIGDHPVIGVGPSGYMDAVTATFDDDWFTRASVGTVLNSPHNLLLQVWAATGAVGLLVVLVAMGFVIWRAIGALRDARGARRDLLAAAAVALPAVMVGWLTHMTAPSTVIPFAVLLGALVSTSPIPGVHRWQDIAMRALTSAAAVFVLLCAIADATLRSGISSVRDGQVATAESLVDTAQRLRPWDADIPLVAAEAFGGALDQGIAGAAEPALRWSRAAVGALPASARAAQAEGMIALAAGDIATARSSLERAVVLSPADPRLWHELGITRAADEDLEAARDALERALHLAPDSEVTRQALETLSR